MQAIQDGAHTVLGKHTTGGAAVAALLAIGATLCTSSLFVLVRRALRLRSAIQASGVVIRIEPVYEARSVGVFDRILVPREVTIMHFRTADKVDVVARLPPTRSGHYRCGQRVSFLYAARDPQYIVRSQIDYWLDLIPFLRLGTFCFASLLWLR